MTVWSKEETVEGEVVGGHARRISSSTLIIVTVTTFSCPVCRSCHTWPLHRQEWRDTGKPHSIIDSQRKPSRHMWAIRHRLHVDLDNYVSCIGM